MRGYFFAAADLEASTLAAASAYFLVKRSTRPAVSISFCLPVKNGWQLEQISSEISPLCVLRVMNTLPHAQCTRTCSYAGWILGFISGQNSSLKSNLYYTETPENRAIGRVVERQREGHGFSRAEPGFRDSALAAEVIKTRTSREHCA